MDQVELDEAKALLKAHFTDVRKRTEVLRLAMETAKVFNRDLRFIVEAFIAMRKT